MDYDTCPTICGEKESVQSRTVVCLNENDEIVEDSKCTKGNVEDLERCRYIYAVGFG